MGGVQVFENILSVNFQSGIKTSEIEDRRHQYGTAQVEDDPPQGFFALLWGALEDFTLRILLAASIISIAANTAVAEDDHRSTAWIEGFAIFVAVVVCSTVTAANDYQKERQFRKLKEVSGSKKQINIWRDGTLIGVHETELVTGDIVKINEGMDIPVDMLVLEAHDITTDESALTGEPDAIKKMPYKVCLEKRDEIIAKGQKNSSKSHDVYSPILMSGTSVLTGEGKALILVVGQSSVLGQIRQFLVQEAETTPLQQKLETIARDIGKFGLISAGIILVILIIRFLVERSQTDTWGEKSQYIKFVNFFIIAITVIAVAIPEGLPLSVTLSLAYSVKKMMKDNNLVRKLQATETMGGANNICSDKTGTLTQNKMNLTNFWNERLIDVNPYDKGTLTEAFPEKYQDMIRQALACNGSATLVPYVGSKTEIALLEYLQNKGEDYEALRKQYTNQTTVKFPFSSQRKRMTTVLQNVENGTQLKQRMHVKGASEIVLETCSHFYSFEEDRVIPMTEVLKRKIEDEINGMASKALRTLCVAYKEINGNEDFTTKDDKNVYEIEKSNFILVGVLGIRDILRKEVKEAVRRCKSAGIKVRMVTGDNAITARAIALECGIIDPKDEHSIVMTGPEFIEATGGIICKACKTKECDCPRDKATAKKKNKEVRVDTIANGAAFDKIIPHFDVMARSRPEDKYALVTGLLERGAVVAVTGDGTNDAPALKKADVGFAMNTGTDVAKEAADIVLLDDNFASIVRAAMWGRNIYDNIKKFLQFQLTVNVVAVFMTLISAAVLQEELLTAIQLLWVNLIMDTLASLALATEPPTEDLLDRKPHNRNEYIVSREMMKHILCQSAYQFTIMMILAFSADTWVPEYLGYDIGIHEGTPYLKFYSDSGHMRSGRPYYITHAGDDYKRYEDEIGPSRHYTLIFNTFVCMQVFNFMNCRKIHEERNIFAGICRNPFFVGIVILIAGIQLIVGNVGGIAFHVSEHAMDVRHWLIAIAFGFGGLVWGFLLRMIPINKLCPKAGSKMTDPLQSSSKILSVKRSHNEDTLHRKFSSINRPDAKGGSITKVQYHAVNN
jgi:Ca2+ transporting ATPase